MVKVQTVNDLHFSTISSVMRTTEQQGFPTVGWLTGAMTEGLNDEIKPFLNGS